MAKVINTMRALLTARNGSDSLALGDARQASAARAYIGGVLYFSVDKSQKGL